MKYLVRIVVISVIALSITAAVAIAGAPGGPTDLTLKIEGKGFLLTWKASPDDPGSVTGYEIERATMAGGPFKNIARVKKGFLKYHDLKAKPENIYFYKVRAVAGKEHSPYSNTVTGELPGY
jgi:Fibronectin type III domain